MLDRFLTELAALKEADRAELRRHFGLDAESIVKTVLQFLKVEA